MGVIFGMMDAEHGRSPLPSKPLCGYLRLTSDRDGNKIGYDVQRKAITAWAEATGQTIGAWYQDKDLTAASLTVERPEYERMLADIAKGEWGGIVVWRLDRLVRLVREFERCNKILEDANAYIMSLEPLLSTRDDMGRFVIRLLVMLAEMEISAMRIRQRGHQRLKAEQGKASAGGKRVFGFEGAIRDDEGRILNQGRIGIAHVPEEAALIREAARRIAWEGESPAEVVADWLSRDPMPVGTDGKPFSTTTLLQVLRSPKMAGLRTHTIRDMRTDEVVRTDLFPGEWEEILDKETWDRLHTMKKIKETPSHRPYEYLLTGGTALCGRCGMRMKAKAIQVQGTDVTHRTYMCPSEKHEKAQGHCGKNAIYASVLEPTVIESVVQRMEATPGLIDAVNVDATAEDPRIPTALDTIAECDKRLNALAKMAGQGDISTEEWMAFRTGAMDQRKAAQSVIEAARSTHTVPRPVGTEREDLRAWIAGLSTKQRRSFIGAHVKGVIVAPGKRGGGSTEARLARTLARIEIVFTDAQVSDAGRDQSAVSDLHADALPLAPSV